MLYKGVYDFAQSENPNNDRSEGYSRLEHHPRAASVGDMVPWFYLQNRHPYAMNRLQTSNSYERHDFVK